MPAARRSARRAWVPPAVALVAVAVLGVALVAGGGSPDGPAPTSSSPSEPATTAAPGPVAISSDAPTYATLDELLAATDLVVRARVTSTERGRVFGEPGDGAALESRFVALEVTEVLRGAAPPPEFLVEQEGWLLDGSPLIVDGLPPSAEGDDAIWFLVDPSATEPAPFVTVNGQGRYRVDGTALVGADGDDPLVARVEALGVEGLEEAVRAAG